MQHIQTVQSQQSSFYKIFSVILKTFDLLRLPSGNVLHGNTRSLQRSFQGCMQMIHIDDHLADLRAVEQGLIGTFENVSLDMCAIIDRYKHKIGTNLRMDEGSVGCSGA